MSLELSAVKRDQLVTARAHPQPAAPIFEHGGDLEAGRDPPRHAPVLVPVQPGAVGVPDGPRPCAVHGPAEVLAVGRHVRDEASVRESRRGLDRAGDERALAVLGHVDHVVPGEAVLRGVGGEDAIPVPDDAGALRGDPQVAVVVLEEPEEAARREPLRGAGVEDLEAHAVVAHQPAEGGEPEEPVARLEDAVDGALRQAVGGRPRVDAVVLRGGARDRARAREHAGRAGTADSRGPLAISH